MTSPAVASVAPLLVKDVPRQLPANMSSMEQGWLLYRCDRQSCKVVAVSYQSSKVDGGLTSCMVAPERE